MDQILKPKTAKGKRVLAKKASKVHEEPKKCFFLRTSTANQITVDAMKTLSVLKKPYSIFSKQKNNEIRPFEDVGRIEFLTKKNDCSFFVVGSNSKKRPNNIIMGRTFDQQVADIFELGLENFKQLKNTLQVDYGAKPLIVFAGEQFDELDEFKRLKNFLIDFFVGPNFDGIYLNGIQHVVQIIAHKSKILFRFYKANLSTIDSKYRKLALEEMGPRFDFSLRRSKLASDNLIKQSCKKPIETKVKKVKNIKRSKLGTTFGRVHMNRQDYSRLQTRKMKGLKKSSNKP